MDGSYEGQDLIKYMQNEKKHNVIISGQMITGKTEWFPIKSKK